MKGHKKRPGYRSLPEMANIYQRLQKIKLASNRMQLSNFSAFLNPVKKLSGISS
jgi:hypothetical protein